MKLMDNHVGAHVGQDLKMFVVEAKKAKKILMLDYSLNVKLHGFKKHMKR